MTRNRFRLSRNLTLLNTFKSQTGFSLLEIIAVIAIMGVLTLAAAVRMSPTSLGNFGSRVDARRLVDDLNQARRRAIATGDNHLLAFQTSGLEITGYKLQRRSGSGLSDVDSIRSFPDHVTVTLIPPAVDPEFSFEGESLLAHTITLTATDRTWNVIVASATGAASATEVP